jgi:hypothetical protein
MKAFSCLPFSILCYLSVFHVVIGLENVGNVKDLVLVNTVKGHLIADTYDHYKLDHAGHYKLELITVAGDADLYITDKHFQADFTNYDSHSITYGIDEVFVNKNMKRPVAIGIYAHPYYANSDYVLNIYSCTLSEKDSTDFDTINDDYFSNSFKQESTYAYNHNKNNNQNHFAKSKQTGSSSSAKNKPYGDLNDSDEDRNGSFVWSLLFKLLEFLVEVFM